VDVDPQHVGDDNDSASPVFESDSAFDHSQPESTPSEVAHTGLNINVFAEPEAPGLVIDNVLFPDPGVNKEFPVNGSVGNAPHTRVGNTSCANAPHVHSVTSVGDGILPDPSAGATAVPNSVRHPDDWRKLSICGYNPLYMAEVDRELEISRSLSNMAVVGLSGTARLHPQGCSATIRRTPNHVGIHLG
jgi:hypothetical protein